MADSARQSQNVNKSFASLDWRVLWPHETYIHLKNSLRFLYDFVYHSNVCKCVDKRDGQSLSWLKNWLVKISDIITPLIAIRKSIKKQTITWLKEKKKPNRYILPFGHTLCRFDRIDDNNWNPAQKIDQFKWNFLIADFVYSIYERKIQESRKKCVWNVLYKKKSPMFWVRCIPQIISITCQ